MLPYELSDRAERDFRKAREYYDRDNVDLGNRFIDSVLMAIRVARERPTSFPRIRRNIHAVRCNVFPYRVYFQVLSDRIRVLAIYHTARNPKLWDHDARD